MGRFAPLTMQLRLLGPFELRRIDGARHELLMETDPRRAQFWAAFDKLAARVC